MKILKFEQFEPLVQHLSFVDKTTGRIGFNLPHDFNFNVLLSMQYFKSGIKREFKDGYIFTHGVMTNPELLNFFYESLSHKDTPSSDRIENY